MITLFSKKSIFFISLFLIGYAALAQKNFTGLTNPEFSLNIKNESPWSFSFGAAQRDLVYKNNDFDFQDEFFELNHYTSYQIGFHSKVSAGIRYRFVKDKKNETRFIEQYAYSKKYNRIKIAHRLRLAQRLREQTVYRTRYRFSVEFPLSGTKTDAHEFFMVTSTEAVWEMGKEQLPTFGQRLSVGIGYKLTPKTRLGLALEYRYRNYTQSPSTQLFAIPSVKISL